MSHRHLCLLCVLLSSIAPGASGCGGSREGASTAEEAEQSSSGGDDDWGNDEGWGEAAAPGDDRSGHAAALDLMQISGPEVPWEQMTANDREMYMVGKVLPIMQELFARQDPERWSSYSCETCHGEAMREVEFRMPPASSFSVPAPGTPAWTGMERTSPEIVRFMRETVTPTMGTLLGVEEFTCNGCHPAR